MTNPLLIAAKGKGFLPMLVRGKVIVDRYGLTPLKMEAALAALANTLNQYDCSATVPVTASALAAHPNAARTGILTKLELAVHGLHHVDYSLLSLERQLKHLRQARNIFERLGLPVSGFRCPYLRWNADTLTALKRSGFTYDSSQALAFDVLGVRTTDGYRRALEFYRAQSSNAFPALPGWSDDLIRIPYSLPDDEALVDRLHLTQVEAMAEIWLTMLENTHQTGELFTLGLHPERAVVCQAALRAVLEKARSLSPGVWIARLDEIAGWFRALGAATYQISPEGGDLYYLKISAPARSTVLARLVEVIADTQPWVGDYQVVQASEFFVRSKKRPVIGLAPDSSAQLRRFLRHQGYLVEESAEAQPYAVHLNFHTFSAEDEKPLLAELEHGRWPLVRLWRWPDAARCALGITGDLDAFTLWDFARRMLAS